MSVFQRLIAIKNNLEALLFSQVSKKKVDYLLYNLFGEKVFLENRTGNGSHTTYWVSDQRKKYIAVVKVANRRRAKKLLKKYKAIKRYKITSSQERLQREYEMLQLLYEQGLSPKPLIIGTGYLVQEFIYGEPLSKLNGDGKKDVLKNVRRILKAIKEIHGINIVHHDLKLDNIFITSEGIKFIDFEHELDPERYSKIEICALDYYRYVHHLLLYGVIKNTDELKAVLQEHFQNENREVGQVFLKMVRDEL